MPAFPLAVFMAYLEDKFYKHPVAFNIISTIVLLYLLIWYVIFILYILVPICKTCIKI